MRLFKQNTNKEKKSIKKKFYSLLKKTKSLWKKNIIKNKTKFTFKESLIFMLITFFLGMLIGGIIMYGKTNYRGSGKDALNEFVSTYNDILNNYYQEVDGKELLESGIEGMINYLGDPYAAYMDTDETEEFSETVEGEYCGIGAEIIFTYADSITKIGNVFENSPAMKAGLQEGDIIVGVNGESIEGKTSADIASLVKGKKGTEVTIKILRSDEELEFTITRDTVDIPSVTSEVYEENEKKIGYLLVDIFANNTDEQFEKELKELEKENIDSLIIDVRGNSGGYLTTVTNIISLFTEKGSSIYQLKTKGEIEIIKDKTNDVRKYPIAVLVDSRSASASEVLSAALKENYGATIIGTNTFGKGKVQKSYKLSNGSLIKYTYQEWLTPNGNSIDGVGIEPNIMIQYKYEKDAKIDNQLKEAIKEISQK